MMLEAAFAARKPLPRKRAKKRRDSRPRCGIRGCTRPARVTIDVPAPALAPELAVFDFYCLTHAKAEADKLARKFVLDRDDWTCQRCMAHKDDVPMQWCHVLSRDALSIRWDPENSMALCQGCHYFFTVQPARWAVFLERYWPGRFERLHLLRQQAYERGDKPDYAEIITDLRAKVGA